MTNCLLKCRRRAALLFFLTLLSGLAFSQEELNMKQFIDDSLKIMKVKLIRPQFKLDNRVAFHGTQALTLNGFDAGFLLSNKLRVTLGYYGMKGQLKEYDEVRGDQQYGRTIQMNYGSINTELIYKDWRFFSLGMPLEIGAGVNTFKDKNITKDEVSKTTTGGLAFINFGISGTFRPMRFLGLKGILGYRKAVFDQVKDFDFDGFFTSIGLNIDIHEVTTDIKMFRLKKKYHRGNAISNAVDILTD